MSSDTLCFLFFCKIMTIAAITMLIARMTAVITTGSTILVKDVVSLADFSTENRKMKLGQIVCSNLQLPTRSDYNMLYSH